MEKNLRSLGHAGDGFNGKVAEGVDCPGILEGVDETRAVGCFCYQVQDELGVCFDGVDAAVE